ncbi:hypothetical protein NIES4106_38490 [Fischerella sp. NIES-4106]|nr:hypothetical protein NIES4106_38490 [Fischerella sp. NIES-4106]
MKRIEVEKRCILIGLAGSHGYGLNRPDSDYDYRGVFIAPKRYYLGFNQSQLPTLTEYSEGVGLKEPAFNARDD